MGKSLKEKLEEAFEAGTNWKEKYSKKHYIIADPADYLVQPDFTKFYQESYMKKCDNCGKFYKGKSYNMYDENYNVEKGLRHCGCLFV